MGAIPRIRTEHVRGRLVQIEGAMPRLNAIPPGCAFSPRCSKRLARCSAERPDLGREENHAVACWLHAAS
jgi:peptide/nickel transport system ATP-binding protein